MTDGIYDVGIAVSDDVGITDQIWQINVGDSGDVTPPHVVDFEYSVTASGDEAVSAEMVATFSEGVQVRPIDVARDQIGTMKRCQSKAFAMTTIRTSWWYLPTICSRTPRTYFG